jgi:hypothetical protein
MAVNSITVLSNSLANLQIEGGNGLTASNVVLSHNATLYNDFNVNIGTFSGTSNSTLYIDGSANQVSLTIYDMAQGNGTDLVCNQCASIELSGPSTFANMETAGTTALILNQNSPCSANNLNLQVGMWTITGPGNATITGTPCMSVQHVKAGFVPGLPSPILVLQPDSCEVPQGTVTALYTLRNINVTSTCQLWPLVTSSWRSSYNHTVTVSNMAISWTGQLSLGGWNYIIDSTMGTPGVTSTIVFEATYDEGPAHLVTSGVTMAGPAVVQCSSDMNSGCTIGNSNGASAACGKGMYKMPPVLASYGALCPW